MKVNTFIVGAPKSGTTSLHYYLNQHSQICMSSIKEPNYFSAQEVEDLYYDSPIIKSASEYEKLFQSDLKVKGESSVSYLYYDLVPHRIFDYNPDAKIIIMLRNPTDRLFSHYLMDKRLGFCSLSLDEIYDQRQQYPKFFMQFFSLGNYYEQIKRYRAVFDDRQIQVILYDDFKNNTNLVVNSVLDFLEVDRQPINLEIKNQMLSPSSSIVAFLYKFKFFRKSFNFIFPKQLLKFVKKTFFNSSKKEALSSKNRDLICNYYQDDISNLEKLIAKDLSSWKS